MAKIVLDARSGDYRDAISLRDRLDGVPMTIF